MIYQLNDDYIDLNKLEYVSKIYIYEPKNQNRFDFSIQINGNTYTSKDYDTKEIAEEEKDHLIKAWNEYKDQK